MEEMIKARLEKLIAERDDLIRKANDRVAFLNGAIAVLEDLLKGDEPPKEE